MKYVIYQRVSTDTQEVETQQRECLNYIKTKEKGASFEYNIYSDPDTSSFRVKMSKRKGLMEFLNDLRPGNHVVVYKLDRLSRDIIEMVTIYRMIKDKKCAIYSLNDPDCDNEFMVGLMGVVAQKERKDTSDRTKSHLRQKKEQKERSGTVPYGYTIDPHKLVWVNGMDEHGRKTKVQKLGALIEDPSEQLILAQMIDLFDQGCSYRQIGHRLKAMGYKNRKGNPFQHNSIYMILCRLGHTRSLDQPLEEIEFQQFHSHMQ